MIGNSVKEEELIEGMESEEEEEDSDEEGNPVPDAIYYACVIADATACCSQGLEFVLEGDYTYPDDYPELGTDITVVGTFDTYDENGQTYCHLIDAKLQ